MVAVSLIEERLRAGRFTDAAELLGQAPHERVDPLWLAIQAEVFERVGRVSDALALAQRACKRGHGSRAHAKALTVLGVMQLEEGQSAQSVASLQAAVRVAGECQATEEAAWSSCRLFLSQFECDPEFDLDVGFKQSHNAAERHREVSALAALHAFASEAYAKRGLLDEAREHLNVALTLSGPAANPWLSGLVATARFCVSYLDMDYHEAEDAANAALRFAQISGHVRSELAAIINLAHVRMHQQRREEAGRMLRRALSMCDISLRCRDYTKEGLAQLEVSRGELEVGSNLLTEVIQSDSPSHAYPRVWVALTRAEMLLGRGMHAECEEQCRKGIAQASHAGGNRIAMQLYLVLAECLASTGKGAEAGAALAQARMRSEGAPISVVAQLNRRAARVLSLAGLPTYSESLHLRAQRIDEPGGKTELCCAEVGGVEHTANGARLSMLASTFDRLAFLMEQRMQVEVAIPEVIELIQEVGCCSYWVLIKESVTGNDEKIIRASHAGPLRLSPDAQRILIAGLDGHVLVVQPIPTTLGHEAVSSLRRILAGRHQQRGPKVIGSPPVVSRQHTSVGMRTVLELARKAATSDAPILLVGETGVGKEWLASKIHEWSRRKGQRFLGFNCSAVPREMLDPQLFGHRKGAFTGADQHALGLVRAVEGGTLLLDEIAEVPIELQVKLLRFLETHEVHPIGENVPVTVNVRIITATNRDPADLVSGGVLRPDLLYRINVITIRIPPLRERREEIVPLAEHYIWKVGQQDGKSGIRLSPAVKELFCQHDWPGNVRQLVNEIRRAVALTDSGCTITPEVLSDELRDQISSGVVTQVTPAVSIELDQSLSSATRTLETACIMRALEITSGRRDSAAALLGLSRKGLYLKCRRLGISTEAISREDAASALEP